MRKTQLEDSSSDEAAANHAWCEQGVVTQNFDREPYPWERFQDEDDDANDIPQPPPQDDEVLIDQHDIDAFTIQVNIMANVHAQTQPTCLAITYGVGLVDLGRRDLMFDWTDVHTLVHRIHQLWLDHAARGRLNIHFVRIQPQNLDHRPYLVFLVHIDYGTMHLNDRCVLMHERGDADSGCRDEPYGAIVHTHASPRALVAQLGHDQCFPQGMRDFVMKVAGVEIDNDLAVVIHNGYLCELEVGPYPEYVISADERMYHAEEFFQQARALHESLPSQQPIVVRVHGISPRNKPLGSRDIPCQFEQLQDLDWIRTARTFWPFQDDFADLVFVVAATSNLDDEEAHVLHCIVNYHCESDGAPILIRQRMWAVHQDREIVEYWAVVLDRDARYANVRHQLLKPPCWVGEDFRSQMHRESIHLTDREPDWRNGQILDIRVAVVDKFFMLTGLMDLHRREDPYEYEENNLLQTSFGSRSTKTAKHARANVQANDGHDAFVEICEQLRADVEQISVQPTADDASVKMEGNRHPRKPDPKTCRNFMLDQLDDALQRLFSKNWQGINPDFRAIDQWHPMTQCALSCCQDWTGAEEIFHIYTDGSCKDDNAAWGFVVVAEAFHEGRKWFYKVGFAGGSVMDDIGPAECTAMDAEATAIAAAAEYVLTRENPPGKKLQFHIHFDNQAAGFGAMGSQNIPVQQHGESTRQRDARILMSLAQQKHCIHPNHVHAHCGQPWNEGADSVAMWIRNGGTCPIPAVLQSGQLLQHPLKEWAWIQVVQDSDLPGLREILKDVSVQETGMFSDPTLRQPHPAKEQQNITCTLKVATMNVATMEYRFNATGESISVKAKEIMHQCQEANLDIVALQETRARNTETRRDGDWLRFISAGQGGHHGVEIWVNLRSVQKKTGIYLDPSTDFVAWHSDERILAVYVGLGNEGLNLVSAYAPQAGRPMCEIQQWWAHATTVLKDRQDGSPIWFMADVNGRVGSVQSECIGDLAADFEDEAGMLFHDMCRQIGLAVPSTFPEVHCGTTNTYVNPQGHTTRIDFIAVDHQCMPGIIETRILDEFELLTGEQDHKVLSMMIGVEIGRKKETGFRRHVLYDRNQARKDMALRHCICMSYIPDITWQTGVNDHWDWIRESVQHAVVANYPRPRRQQRQLYFNENTWNLLCQRKDMRIQFRNQQKTRNRHFLAMIFAAWKGKQVGPTTEQAAYNLHCANLSLAVLYEQRSSLDLQFRQCKRDDWRSWVESQAQERLQAAKKAKGADIYKIFKPKAAIAAHAGKNKRPLPGLRDAQGRWRKGKQEVAIAWQQQFAKLENAVETSVQEMCPASEQVFQARAANDLIDIPTLLELEQAIRAIDASKAPGVDMIGGEILRQDVVVSSRKLYPLLLKMALRGQWPPELSGGWLLPLYKGKGDPRSMMMHRGILLESTIARAYSRAWRPRVVQGLDRTACPNQWGG